MTLAADNTAVLDVQPWVASATAAVRKGQFEQARAILELALLTAPSHPRALALLGAAYEGLGKPTEAEAAYERALNSDDRDLSTALALARLYEKRGAQGQAVSLANFILLREQRTPDLRREAAALRDRLQGDA